MGVRSVRHVRFARVIGTALVFMAMLFGGGSARADDARERARVFFREGVEAFARAEYITAHSAFENAYRLAPHPSVRLNLGHCEEMLGNPLAARDNFRAYLAEATDISPIQRHDVEDAITRVETHIGRVTVAILPEGTPLFVDDRPASIDGTGSVELAEGVHQFRVQGASGVTVSRSLTVAGGATQRLELDASPLAPAPPLLAAAEPAPAAPVEPAPRLAARRRSLRPWAIGFGALAVATAGGSLAVGLLARRADDDFDRQVKYTRDPALTTAQREEARQDGLDAVDRTHRFARLSDGLLGATAVAAVVSVTLAVVQHRRGRSERRSVGAALTPTRGGAALALSGRF